MKRKCDSLVSMDGDKRVRLGHGRLPSQPTPEGQLLEAVECLSVRQKRRTLSLSSCVERALRVGRVDLLPLFVVSMSEMSDNSWWRSYLACALAQASAQKRWGHHTLARAMHGA